MTTCQATTALTPANFEHYREHAWVAVPGVVDIVWLDRLRAVTDEFVEPRRALTESNVVFDVDVGRGEPARWARHDARPCLVPPTGPYRPIFAAQQRDG